MVDRRSRGSDCCIAAAGVLHGALGTATHGTVDYNLLFRWCVGLSADDPVWDATVFCKNRDRLLDGDIAVKFFAGVLNLPKVRKLLSSEHFSVDGTLTEAWASMKSFVPKAGGKPPSSGEGRRNAERNFRGEKAARSHRCHKMPAREKRSLQQTCPTE
jgi:hypothetical protein